MRVVGIIGEYNPFHFGHLYHIQKTKEKFPDSILILALNGCFSQRGDVSILSVEDKVRISLQYGVDIVVQIPTLYGTQSADIFADCAISLLHELGVTDIVFGSETNSIKQISLYAKKQLKQDLHEQMEGYLRIGLNYPTALSKSVGLTKKFCKPNDLLGISYAKTVFKNHYEITLHTILRTNSYHDLSSNTGVVSASNIRHKLENQEDVQSFLPKDVYPLIHSFSSLTLWKMLQYKILTDANLALYLTVDEGIENRLQKMAPKASSIEEFMRLVKTKRYTYNKLQRMMIHILLGITKEENEKASLSYIPIVGFRETGKKYLHEHKCSLPYRVDPSSVLYQIELRAAFVYELLTNHPAYPFVLCHKPIQYFDK